MVGALIDGLDLAPAILVGNCMGSGIALGYAVRHRAQVAALALCNVLTERTALAGRLGWLHRLTVRPPLARRATRALARRLAIPRWADRPILALQHGDGAPDPEWADHAATLHRRPGGPRVLFDLFCHLDSFAALDRLGPEAGLPRLAVVWGERNQVLPAEGGRELVRRLAPAITWFAPGAGHMVMRERADEVSRLIEQLT
jgi:pimeloyl-ACP methyl ester carboxylesterase